MIELAHDVNFLSKLLETFLGFHETKIETLHSIFDTGGFVRDEPNKAGNAGAKDGTVMYAIIDLLNRFAEWYLCIKRRLAFRLEKKNIEEVEGH